jgi:hypothetical protein
MHFLRFQEFYESPNPKFRGNTFDIFDFMEWYSKKYGNGSFTYPNDWGGFNIPGVQIESCLDELNYEKVEYNKYDSIMHSVHESLMKHSGADKFSERTHGDFYVIGCLSDNDALEHEIAHALFYLNEDYKKEVTKLVGGMSKSLKNKIYSNLKKLGYTKEVYIDECQAYMATGLMRELEGKFQKERKPFIETFKKYYLK